VTGQKSNEAEQIAAKPPWGVSDVWQGKEIGEKRPVAASPVAEVHEISPESKMRTGMPRPGPRDARGGQTDSGGFRKTAR